jgi:gamma-glutamyltranspeptidase/glutathione hydrolase
MTKRNGFVRLDDLQEILLRELTPLKTTYREMEVLSFPIPGGGGTVIGALNILDAFPTEALASGSGERLHLLIEAFRMARADHLLYSPDPNRQIGKRPLRHLQKRHARERAGRIREGKATPEKVVGTPSRTGDMGDHTTHVSVIDHSGNAVSLTQTLGSQFGAKRSTAGLGFPYNSILENFDFEDPDNPSYLHPGSRLLTDMAPTIVVSNGVARFVLGSTGSERIPPHVVQVVSNVVDRSMGIGAAVTAPRVLWGGAPPNVHLEITGEITEDDAVALEEMGFPRVDRTLLPAPPFSLGFFGGVNAVAFDPTTGMFSGIGDPRRSGYAEGPASLARATQEDSGSSTRR